MAVLNTPYDITRNICTPSSKRPKQVLMLEFEPDDRYGSKYVVQSMFDSVAFPMVRRVFAKTLAQDIVAVQPLSLPEGFSFYTDATYPLIQYNKMLKSPIKGDERYLFLEFEPDDRYGSKYVPVPISIDFNNNIERNYLNP